MCEPMEQSFSTLKMNWLPHQVPPAIQTEPGMVNMDLFIALHVESVYRNSFFNSSVFGNASLHTARAPNLTTALKIQ